MIIIIIIIHHGVAFRTHRIFTLRCFSPGGARWGWREECCCCCGCCCCDVVAVLAVVAMALVFVAVFAVFTAYGAATARRRRRRRRDATLIITSCRRRIVLRYVEVTWKATKYAPIEIYQSCHASSVRPSSPRGVHPNACRAWHPVHTNYTSFHVSVVVVDDYYYHHRPTANSPRNASINVANSNRAEFQSRSTIADGNIIPPGPSSLECLSIGLHAEPLCLGRVGA